MDVELLSRIQFAVTIGFHFIFPPLSIGLAWLLVVLEWRAWKAGCQPCERSARFFAKVLGAIFAAGVATGLTMEFQFGTNWSRFSEWIGPVFGTQLIPEAVFAFFVESTCIAIYLFGRGRVSRGLHFASILLVALGATLSAFLILAVNSWMQTPEGFHVAGGRAVLDSFWDALFTASTWPRFTHTIASCLAAGGFLMAGLAALLVRRGQDEAAPALKAGVIAALAGSLLCAFPTGHWHAVQVARTQPEKLATIEGLIDGGPRAPLIVFGIPSTDAQGNPEVKAKVAIPGGLSLLAHHDLDEPVPGLNELRARNLAASGGAHADLPPFALPFIAFHSMVGIGSAMIALAGLAAFLLWRGRLASSGLMLRLLPLAIPLPILAQQLGWITAEVGRQPWVVWRHLRTAEAFSPVVDAGQVLASLIGFGVVYALLFVALLAVIVRLLGKGLPSLGGTTAIAAPPAATDEGKEA